MVIRISLEKSENNGRLLHFERSVDLIYVIYWEKANPAPDSIQT